MTRIFWIGFVTKNSPHGFNDEYREYVELDEGEDYSRVGEAVVRLAKSITIWKDGHAIKVQELKGNPK